jgi:hypothetical protein
MQKSLFLNQAVPFSEMPVCPKNIDDKTKHDYDLFCTECGANAFCNCYEGGMDAKCIYCHALMDLEEFFHGSENKFQPQEKENRDYYCGEHNVFGNLQDGECPLCPK